MHFGVCQIILVILYAISLGTVLAMHGKPKTGKYSFWTGLISVGIEMTLLILGGFFS